MSTVTISRELFEELMDLKLKHLTQRINEILSKWEYKSIEKFLNDAANGILAEAEPDAISLTNLFDKREELFKLRHSEC